MHIQHVSGVVSSVFIACLPSLAVHHLQGSPHDALKIAADVGAKQSFATHWGTWCMSDERWDEPLLDLKAALKQEKLPGKYLTTPPFGRTVQVD